MLNNNLGMMLVIHMNLRKVNMAQKRCIYDKSVLCDDCQRCFKPTLKEN